MFQKPLLIAFCLISFFATSQNIESVRNQYPAAQEDSELATQLYEELSKVSNTNPVLLAYKGAVSTLQANFAKKVKNKKAFFAEGAQHIEEAVQAAPQNIEIRYIRMSVQENAPKFLGYHDNIEEDKQFILEHLSKTDAESLKNEIVKFIKVSSNFDEVELSTLKELEAAE